MGILAETYERIATETGGILLGVFSEHTWYVLESIDPGPNSIFTPSYFEYDRAYTEHLANKVRRSYKAEISLLGLWHRHPGGFDSFSRTDDATNIKYARLHPKGAISGLVNIDPVFRFTLYHVSDSLTYRKIPVQYGNDLIPKEYLQRKEAHDFIDRLPAQSSIRSTTQLGEAAFTKVETIRNSNGGTGIGNSIVTFLNKPLFGSRKEKAVGKALSTEQVSLQDATPANDLDKLLVMVDQELESFLKKQDCYDSLMNLEGEMIRVTLKRKLIGTWPEEGHRVMDAVFAYEDGHGVVISDNKKHNYEAGILKKLALKQLS